MKNKATAKKNGQHAWLNPSTLRKYSSSCNLRNRWLHEKILTFIPKAKVAHAFVDSGGLEVEVVFYILKFDLASVCPGEKLLDILGSIDVWT